jgi:acyl-coenzyme A synthetase/AMP-(fatty) acid ligase
MFTSGSTGRPKGVVVSHRSLVATYVGQRYASFGRAEVWLQCSPVSWDAFALELFGALLFGGVCVLHPGQRPDPETVVDLVRQHSVTQLQLSASLFNFLVDEHLDSFGGLRRVFTGGERASVAHVERVRRRFPGLVVVNGYGPVESLGFTTFHEVGRVSGSSVPVGVPLAGKRVYVLDDFLRPVPAGVTGEVYAAGVGLAYGYVGRSGLTGERFVADPFAGGGERMYRTGDLGRWTGEGLLDVVGRIDDQVKVRGFRVELGEVEHALAGHPLVRESAVVARVGGDGCQLAAYVVPMPGARVTHRGLAADLATTLPDFMIPTTTTTLEALPLTPNGKLDRTRLPEPEDAWRPPVDGVDGTAHVDGFAAASPSTGDRADAAPPDAPLAIGAGAKSSGGQTTRVQAALMPQIAEVWREVLGVVEIGPDDDFFARGGHSLNALRAVYRIRDRLGRHVSLRTLLDSSSLRDFTERLMRQPEEGMPHPLRPLRRVRAR